MVCMPSAQCAYHLTYEVNRSRPNDQAHAQAGVRAQMTWCHGRCWSSWSCLVPPKAGRSICRFRWSRCSAFTSCSNGLYCLIRPWRRRRRRATVLGVCWPELGHSRLPEESMILRFRHLLERHKLAEQILAVVNNLLSGQGLFLKASRVVDATLIATPTSTKTKDGRRGPDMHQSKKGNERFITHVGPHRRGC
jgi:hypothetical protein